MESLTIKFLDKEPKKTSGLQRLLYCFTRPLADFLLAFTPQKTYRIFSRRKLIARLNKRDYIEEVSKILFDEVLTHGNVEDLTLCKMICIEEAREIFYERKANGGFDDLNIMI